MRITGGTRITPVCWRACASLTAAHKFIVRARAHTYRKTTGGEERDFRNDEIPRCLCVMFFLFSVIVSHTLIDGDDYDVRFLSGNDVLKPSDKPYHPKFYRVLNHSAPGNARFFVRNRHLHIACV